MTTHSITHLPAGALDESFSGQWSTLYRISAVAVGLALLVIPISIGAYFLWPPPETVLGHFAQYQESRLAGAVGMDLLYLLPNILLIPTWLAFYVALKRTNISLIALSVVSGLIATIMLIPTRPIVEMARLSDLYTTGTAAQQTAALGAGEALLAIYGGTAYNVHYILGSLALIVICYVMLQSDVFSHRIAYVGLAANIITLGFYIPVVGVYISIFSVLFYFVWYVMMARRFWQLGNVDGR
ncbi:MAG: DUF4386 family protein [Chloroflexota bacterium]